jgi:hypothetical protein
VLAAFAVTCRTETDLNRLTAALIGVVQETIQPTHVALWLPKTPAPNPKPMPGILMKSKDT